MLQTGCCEADGSAEHGHCAGSLREVAEIAGGADYDLDGRVFVDWMHGFSVLFLVSLFRFVSAH